MADAPFDAERALTEFSGEVPVFPLPSLVLLPDGFAPLLMFEPRYRALAADAVEGEKLVAMALLKPGWEPLYQGAPPIHETVCLGAVLSHEKLEDGRWKLLLFGLARGRVVEETQREPYRRARVEILADQVPATAEEDLARQVHALLERMPGRRGRIGKMRELSLQVRGPSGGPGRLVDAAAEAADLDAAARYELLAEPDVLRRAQALLRHLDRRARAEPDLPPRRPPQLN